MLKELLIERRKTTEFFAVINLTSDIFWLFFVWRLSMQIVVISLRSMSQKKEAYKTHFLGVIIQKLKDLCTCFRVGQWILNAYLSGRRWNITTLPMEMIIVGPNRKDNCHTRSIGYFCIILTALIDTIPISPFQLQCPWATHSASNNCPPANDTYWNIGAVPNPRIMGLSMRYSRFYNRGSPQYSLYGYLHVMFQQSHGESCQIYLLFVDTA